MSTGVLPFYIVIGASAGGLKAMNELVSQLPANTNSAVFIVIHLAKVGIGDFLVHRLQKYTSYTCTIARHEEKVERNHIYIAPPDQHMLVKDNRVLLSTGPAENRWRPSIDVLFRSAVAANGNRVIGIILSGMLNDGTAGMHAIKKSNGYCIIQDPNEAEYPDMPLSVLENVSVDHSLKLSEMGEAIAGIIASAPSDVTEAPPEIILESKVAENTLTGINLLKELGDKSLYACPDCGGGLWEINIPVKRYRCHIGHSYSQRDLMLRQSEKIEATLWTALRMMEERRDLLNKIGAEENARGLHRLAANHSERSDDLTEHIKELKSLLFAVAKD
jgi:two-component system chemotaxis response regulator CheB